MMASMPRAPLAPRTWPCFRACVLPARLAPCALSARLGSLRLGAVPELLRSCIAPAPVHADRACPRLSLCLSALLAPMPSASSSSPAPCCAPMRLCAVCTHLRPHVAPAPVPLRPHALLFQRLGVPSLLPARSAPAPAVAPRSPMPLFCHAPFARPLLCCPRTSRLVVDPRWPLAGHKRICAPFDRALGWCLRRAPPISLQNIPLAVLA